MKNFENMNENLSIGQMEKLFIEGTTSTPSIECHEDGKICISGRSLPENPLDFYQPLMEWSKNYNADKAIIDIKLEYFNTSTSKVILDLLRVFEEKPQKSSISVNWHYEEGDDDNYESGQMYQEEVTGINFQFIEYPEI